MFLQDIRGKVREGKQMIRKGKKCRLVRATGRWKNGRKQARSVVRWYEKGERIQEMSCCSVEGEKKEGVSGWGIKDVQQNERKTMKEVGRETTRPQGVICRGVGDPVEQVSGRPSCPSANGVLSRPSKSLLSPRLRPPVPPAKAHSGCLPRFEARPHVVLVQGRRGTGVLRRRERKLV